MGTHHPLGRGGARRVPLGAWGDNASNLFEDAEGGADDTGELDEDAADADQQLLDENELPITASHRLYLSGTPFRAIHSGEFIEEQIFNWTYSDEQRAKRCVAGRPREQPVPGIPKMVLMTYQLPDAIRAVAEGGEFDFFDLNAFFHAEGRGDEARFKHEDEVQKWLDLIRGSFKEDPSDAWGGGAEMVKDLKMGRQKPPWPFSSGTFTGLLNHTFWFLPTVAACHAMKGLLAGRQNTYYWEFNVHVAAGAGAGMGKEALPPVQTMMRDPLESQSITLSCGKLTTGVTVRPWTGILMLRNLKRPETYFQAAFRVQSPWTLKNPEGDDPHREDVLKEVCYVFDFAPDRALKQIAEYAGSLDTTDTGPEQKVKDFIDFLPVLAYDGSAMKEIDAAGVLDHAMAGTTATLLAKRWESTLLVNVDNETLGRLMASPEAMAALMSIEGFRSLNNDIETIINKSEAVKKTKAEKADDDEPLTKKEKKELTDAEKEYKSKRKAIQEKLIKLATRLPIFMYLTDFREEKLTDIIMQLEPELFRKVTGLSLNDFDLLVSLNVFNGVLMNNAVYKFKRYEDASLGYLGEELNRHKDLPVGGYDTVKSRDEFESR